MLMFVQVTLLTDDHVTSQQFNSKHIILSCVL